MLRTLIFVCGLVFLVVVLVLFGAGGAWPHSWYDGACCSERDCVQLPDGSVKATEDGWLIGLTGELVPFGDPRERRSMDMHFHRCERLVDHALRCLYVPSQGA